VVTELYSIYIRHFALKPRRIHNHGSLNFRPSHSPSDSHIHLACHSPSFSHSAIRVSDSHTSTSTRLLIYPANYSHTHSPTHLRGHSFTQFLVQSLRPPSHSVAYALAHSITRRLIHPDSRSVPPPTQPLSRIHTRPLIYAYTHSPRFLFSPSTDPIIHSHTHSPTCPAHQIYRALSLLITHYSHSDTEHEH
jgi:hypothetical protein